MARDLIEAVAAIRRYLDFSHAEVGNALGITGSSWGRQENGQTNMDIHTTAKALQFMGVKVSVRLQVGPIDLTVPLHREAAHDQ